MGVRGGIVLNAPERHLHAIQGRPAVDLDAAEDAARGLLVALGADLESGRACGRRRAGSLGRMRSS